MNKPKIKYFLISLISNYFLYNKMKKVIILVGLLIIIFGVQCKKKDENKTILNAHFSVKGTNLPIKNLKTSLVEYFDTGTHDAREIGVQYTDENGNVSFITQVQGNVNLMYYKLFLWELNDYYGESIIEYPYNEITNNHVVSKNVSLYEAGHINLKIVNVYPFDQNDSIFNIKISTFITEEIIYFNSSVGFSGIDVNYSKDLKVISNDNINIQYQVRKNNQTQNYSDTINVTKFVTQNYNINY